MSETKKVKMSGKELVKIAQAKRKEYKEKYGSVAKYLEQEKGFKLRGDFVYLRSDAIKEMIKTKKINVRFSRLLRSELNKNLDGLIQNLVTALSTKKGIRTRAKMINEIFASFSVDVSKKKKMQAEAEKKRAEKEVSKLKKTAESATKSVEAIKQRYEKQIKKLQEKLGAVRKAI